jgi:Ca2+-binding EF-hand superfamily protein
MTGDGKGPVASALLLLLGISLAAAAVDPPKAAPAPEPPAANQPPQLLYLGEKRPLRFRLDLRVRGKPFQQAWEDFLGRLLDYADVNGDKVITADEAARLPQTRVLLGLLRGQVFFPDDKSAAPFAELDGNKDGKVSPDELKAYYRKNGFQPLQAQPDPEQGAAQVLTDALFKHLDRDKDGKLSREELARAEAVLAPLDANEDDLLTPEELVPGLEYGYGRVRGRPGQGEAPILSVVNPDDPPAKQAAPLLTRYDKDKNGKLSRAEFGCDEAAFKALDANKDGQLDATELAAWFKTAADLEMLVPLSDPRPKTPRPASPLARLFGAADERPLRVVAPGGRTPALAAALQKREDGTLLLTTEGARVEFNRDRGSEQNREFFRRFFHEQFRAALRGNKTYLEKKDAVRSPRIKGLFPFLDRNGDGRATEEELNAFLDLLDHGATSFTVVAAGDRGPGLFELLDTNRDRQLSLRELRAAWASVAHWDANKDGSLARQEVPRHLRVTPCSGMPGRRFFGIEEEPATTSAGTRRAGPPWFRGMDVNGDGDVSRREWLGGEEDFRRIDADGDGLISLEEASKADDWYRKKVPPAREGTASSPGRG